MLLAQDGGADLAARARIKIVQKKKDAVAVNCPAIRWVVADARVGVTSDRSNSSGAAASNSGSLPVW